MGDLFKDFNMCMHTSVSVYVSKDDAIKTCLALGVEGDELCYGV